MIRPSALALLGLAGTLLASSEVDAQAYRGGARAGHVVVGPQGGVSAGQSRAVVNSGPFGSSSARAHTGTRVTPGGATVQSASVAGSRSGPFGGSAGRAGAVRVTTPSGQTYTHAGRSGVAAGPGGVVAGGGSRSTVSGPFGAAGVRKGGAVAFR